MVQDRVLLAVGCRWAGNCREGGRGGFNYVGNGLRTCLLGSSPASFPLPSSVLKGRISSFFSLGKTSAHISEDSDNSIKSSISPWCGCC